MLDDILAILNTVGQVVDTPWAAARTAIRDRDIGSGLSSIFDTQARASGRDMLESLGVLDQNQPGLDWGDVAGFAAEVGPDMLLPGAGAYKLLKYLRPADEVAPIGRGFLDAIDKAVPTPSVPAALSEVDLDRLLRSNPIIESADSMLPALPAPDPVAAAPYYSRLRNAIEALPGENFKTQSVLNQLRRLAPEGFAQQEVEWSKLGELLGQGPMVTKAQMLGHMDEALPSYSPNWIRKTGDDVDYGTYRTKTGDEYAEHIATMPSNEELFKSHNWPKINNPLLHTRTELVESPSGRTLLSNELQSDWHQEGSKLGYKGDFDYQSLHDKIIDLGGQAYPLFRKLSSDLRKFDNLGFENAGSALFDIVKHDDWLTRWDMSDAPQSLIDDINKYRALAIERSATWDKLRASEHAITDAPFKEDWSLLGLKELLRQGVESNADTVSWIPGDKVQALVGGKMKGQQQFYDKDLVNIANKYIKNRGWDTAVNVPSSSGRSLKLKYDGQDVYIPEELVSAKDTAGIANAIRNQLTIQGANPDSLAEEILIKAKWGDIGADDFINRPVGNFEIPITPNMRRDIRERGQPLMSIAPLLAILGAFQDEA